MRRQPFSELANCRFGKLIILSDVNSDRKSRYVVVACDCGTVKTVRLADMKYGKITNCGCVRRQKNTERGKHLLSRHPLYRVWKGIIERCEYKKHKYFERYGGRGIYVCDLWRNDFMSFYNWAIDAGWVKGLEIDREDNNGNYHPGNCRIADRKMQTRNKCNNKILEYNGERKCIAEWSDITGLSQGLIIGRINKLKWTAERTLTTPKIIRNVA